MIVFKKPEGESWPDVFELRFILLIATVHCGHRLHIDLTLAPGDYRLFKLGAKQGTAGLPVPDVDTAKRTGTREPITLSNWSIAVQSWGKAMESIAIDVLLSRSRVR